MSMVEGPYAFVFYDSLNQRVFYGRDVLGRRSLMSRRCSEDSIEITSVHAGPGGRDWAEVGAGGLYVLDLALESAPPAPINQNEAEHRTRIAILFSGGLDCTVIARLVHDILPDQDEIDLVNVAFENPRTVQAIARSSRVASDITSAYELCPDRITGRKSLAELECLCHSRKWRFVAVDVPYSETAAHRSEITTLLHPHNTEMDLSIGCALYFAARGIGAVKDLNSEALIPYCTPARVLLSGLGADELFGGYTRHAKAFDRGGYPTLVEELELDFQRLGRRNLGRDDRVISHWGKEVRYPYLDEGLVSWALSVPVWEKCDFGQTFGWKPKLERDKKLLRLLAWTLGLRSPAAERKRAIQFGARTAKMESGKTKGTHIIV
ncbi:MAG: hypothetical protein Q9163_006022 [Psora crenata]